MNFEEMKKVIEDAEKLRDHIMKTRDKIAATSAFMGAFAISGFISFIITLVVLNA